MSNDIIVIFYMKAQIRNYYIKWKKTVSFEYLLVHFMIKSFPEILIDFFKKFWKWGRRKLDVSGRKNAPAHKLGLYILLYCAMSTRTDVYAQNVQVLLR